MYPLHARCAIPLLAAVCRGSEGAEIMQPRHLVLALLVTAIWGFNFVCIKLALLDFPPLLLTSLRFALASVAVLFLSRPNIRWRDMAAIAGPMFLLQYVLLFTAMAVGMPPGLASVTMQVQAFFTIGLAVLILGERPGMRQLGGIACAVVGLALIASTITAGGGPVGIVDVTLAGFLLTIAAGFSWALGNVLLRRAGRHDMLATTAWLSLIPPLPALALSLIFEGPQAIVHSIGSAGLLGWGSLAYIVVISTLAGFAGWGNLLKLYPAATVAPFSLLVIVFGVISSALAFGESFAPLRIAGMVIVVAGLAVVALPWGNLRRILPRGD